jgi:NADH-quinone oxidoreductase subunit G
MAAATLASLGLQSGDAVNVRSAQGQVTLPALADEAVAADCVQISAAYEATQALGSGFGELTVERA